MPDVPTARERGMDLVTQSPIGLVGPRGMDVAAVQDAVRDTTDGEDFKQVLQTYDMGPTTSPAPNTATLPNKCG